MTTWRVLSWYEQSIIAYGNCSLLGHQSLMRECFNKKGYIVSSILQVLYITFMANTDSGQYQFIHPWAIPGNPKYQGTKAITWNVDSHICEILQRFISFICRTKLKYIQTALCNKWSNTLWYSRRPSAVFIVGNICCDIFVDAEFAMCFLQKKVQCPPFKKPLKLFKCAVC